MDFHPYHLAHERMKEAAQMDASRDMLIRLGRDAADELARYLEGLEK